MDRRCTPPHLKWKDLIFARNPKLVTHQINALANCLPAPDMKCKWGYKSTTLCPLCKESQGSQMHILSFCKVALVQGRYSWRHDSVLTNIESSLRAYINRHNDKKPDPTPARLIKFVKAGERAPRQKPQIRKHLLNDASDWKLQIDYKGKERPFPPSICTTSLRPDIVIWSDNKKKVIIIELTCPSEENIQQAIARKNERYLGLINEIKDLGWETNFFTIEAGYVGASQNLSELAYAN